MSMPAKKIIKVANSFYKLRKNNLISVIAILVVAFLLVPTVYINLNKNAAYATGPNSFTAAFNLVCVRTLTYSGSNITFSWTGDSGATYKIEVTASGSTTTKINITSSNTNYSATGDPTWSFGSWQQTGVLTLNKDTNYTMTVTETAGPNVGSNAVSSLSVPACLVGKADLGVRFLFDGGGASATANITGTNSPISSFNITANGSGYTMPPSVCIYGGSGSGATASITTAQMADDGTGKGTKKVTGITLGSGGSGYSSATPPQVLITGAGQTTFAPGCTFTGNVTVSNYGDTASPSGLHLVGAMGNTGYPNTQYVNSTYNLGKCGDGTFNTVYQYDSPPGGWFYDPVTWGATTGASKGTLALVNTPIGGSSWSVGVLTGSNAEQTLSGISSGGSVTYPVSFTTWPFNGGYNAVFMVDPAYNATNTTYGCKNPNEAPSNPTAANTSAYPCSGNINNGTNNTWCNNYFTQGYAIQIPGYIQTQNGGIAAGGNINMSKTPTSGTGSVADFLGVSGGNATLNGVSFPNTRLSQSGWEVTNYSKPIVPAGGVYQFLANRFLPAAKAAGGSVCSLSLITTAGYYWCNGDINVNAAWTPPSGTTIIFANNLNVTKNITYTAGTSDTVVFVIGNSAGNGKINFNCMDTTGVPFVSCWEEDGIFIAQDTIADNYGNFSVQLTFKGALYADKRMVLNAWISPSGTYPGSGSPGYATYGSPAEIITYDPKYMVALTDALNSGANNRLGSSPTNWQEVAP